jgi:hypothetical protein
VVAALAEKVRAVVAREDEYLSPVDFFIYVDTDRIAWKHVVTISCTMHSSYRSLRGHVD